MSSKSIPVTILTGFLGAGKTTLLSYILNQQHGHKIAVIENEFGSVAIDDKLIDKQQTANIKTLSNGCICCSSRNELSEALLELLAELDKGNLTFDYLIIECTGMADPGPIIQTFFTHETLCERFLVDGVITLVDAVHAQNQLNQFEIAQAQIGYADRVLLTKSDINPNNEQLKARLERINIRAPIYEVIYGEIDLCHLFNINGFMLEEKLTLPPTFKFIPKSENKVCSVVIEIKHLIDLDEISQAMENLLTQYADNFLRYKGILAIKNETRRLLFQGVHRLYSADWDREWQKGEEQKSTMVFIGIDLPEKIIKQAFNHLS